MAASAAPDERALRAAAGEVHGGDGVPPSVGDDQIQMSIVIEVPRRQTIRFLAYLEHLFLVKTLFLVAQQDRNRTTKISDHSAVRDSYVWNAVVIEVRSDGLGAEPDVCRNTGPAIEKRPIAFAKHH